MDWEQAEATLERWHKPSPRSFREIVKLLVDLDHRTLGRYAIPHLLERFQDWPATASRVVPPDLRDRVREHCAEVPLYQIFHPADLDLIPDTEWAEDRGELGAQLEELGIPRVSLRCTAAEFELLHAEVPRADGPLVHHGDLTIVSGELGREVVVTGELAIEEPEAATPSQPASPTPLPPRMRGPADLDAARWVDVAEMTRYLDVPAFAEHRDHFEQVLLGTDFSEALIISGDVMIDGDFNRTWLEQFGRDPDVTVVVIDGNLEVRGDVWTAHGGNSADVCLIVIGDVSCRNLFCGGTYMVAVAGVTRCAEAMFAINDHCPLFFADLQAPVAMMDEYWLMGGTQNVGIVTCRQEAGPGNAWPELDQRTSEVFAPELIDDSGVLCRYRVVQWLGEDRSILR